MMNKKCVFFTALVLAVNCAFAFDFKFFNKNSSDTVTGVVLYVNDNLTIQQKPHSRSAVTFYIDCDAEVLMELREQEGKIVTVKGKITSQSNWIKEIQITEIIK